MSTDDIENAISPGQCRAARGLLGWSQDDLAEMSGVSKRTIARFELDGPPPYKRTLNALHSCFGEAGIEFIAENGEGAGLRLKKR